MLYMIRHGKTDWNVLHKLQGQTNIPLNDEGRRMAKAAAKQCRDLRFDVCFCSPLIRAQETAQLLLADTQIPVIYDPRLAEMCFGICEGDEKTAQDPSSPVWALFNEPDKYIPPEGAESFEELFTRTGAFLREKVQPLLKEGKSILIVGHGAMNTCLYHQYHQVPLKDFWNIPIKNCEFMKII